MDGQITEITAMQPFLVLVFSVHTIFFPFSLFFFSFYLFFPPGIPSAPLLPPCVGFLCVEQTGNEALKSFESLLERMHTLKEYNPRDICAA